MFRKIVLAAGCMFLLLLPSCSSSDSIPSTLVNTTWKYSVSTTSYKTLKFTTATSGSFTVVTPSETKYYSFTYAYADPDITIDVSDGEKYSGDLSDKSTMQLIVSNSPTTPLKFTKQ
jgi:major membrane immunogen (membrane-anchored lipoprotein)